MTVDTATDIQNITDHSTQVPAKELRTTGTTIEDEDVCWNNEYEDYETEWYDENNPCDPKEQYDTRYSYSDGYNYNSHSDRDNRYQAYYNPYYNKSKPPW